MVRERVGDWRSAVISAVAGLVAGLIAFAALQSGLLDGPYFAAQDRLFPAPAPDPGITLIAIDQHTRQELGSFPFVNALHAQVINNLEALHPKVILYDVPLDLAIPDTEDPNSDQELIDALTNRSNIVLTCTASRQVFDKLVVGEPIGDLAFGDPDPANAIRSMGLVVDNTCPQNEAHESAVVQAIRIVDGNQDPIDFRGDVARFGKHTIPLVDNQMLVNYSLGGSVTCSFYDAFNGSCPKSLIENRIVVVGMKLIDNGDVYSQPVSFNHDPSFCTADRPHCMLDNQNFGYRIMADAMATILLDRYIQVEPRNLIAAEALGLAVLVGLAVYALSIGRAVLVTGLLLVAYYIFVVLLSKSDYLFDPLFTPAAMVLSATFSLGARYVLVERERRKVERIFGHYVDPRVSRQLADSRSIDDIMQKGERRDLTLLFVDVRGFTAMSEAMRAEDVLAVIHEYLNDMSALILKWDGTIDKYVGDEIVAIWNAPTAQPEHALWALRCAYDMVAQADVLQARLADRGLPPISWGVGINTGPAVVGNMGSRDRLQYTALGDTVNTASRFCSVAPAFTVLIGQATLDACADYIAVEQVPGVQLKGKSADKFRVYQVVAIRETPGSPWATFPTDAATEKYTAIRRSYGEQLLFAAATPGEPD
jgi:adenylate cyclase